MTTAPVGEAIERWHRNRSVFNVSDLHYIGTRFDTRVPTSGLNRFNLLTRGAYAHQSQDSLVISSDGVFTDSHSDDHSGSNHCFFGAKMWLMWDTCEGLEAGIEDVERCPVSGRHAAFDLDVFSTLRSARWLVVSEGQTIFIPGHLSHKVITLSKYLGLGSFYLALPNLLASLENWTRLEPYWSLTEHGGHPRLVNALITRASRKVQGLRAAPRHEQLTWGLPQFFQQKRARSLDKPQSRRDGSAPGYCERALRRFAALDGPRVSA